MIFEIIKIIKIRREIKKLTKEIEQLSYYIGVEKDNSDYIIQRFDYLYGMREALIRELALF